MTQYTQGKFRVGHRRGVRAQGILRLPALRQPPGDGGEERQGGQQEGKVEKFCVASARAARVPGLASWRSISRGRFRDRPPSHVPRRRNRPPTTARGRGSAAATTGWSPHAHHRFTDDLPAALFVEGYRDINAIRLQQLAYRKGSAASVWSDTRAPPASVRVTAGASASVRSSR